MGVVCPVVVRHQHFPSMKEAAAHFGVGSSAVSQMLRRRGDLERLGLGPGVEVGKGRPARPEETVLFGVHFASRCAAARALGLNRKTVRAVALGVASEVQREKVLAALMRLRAVHEGAASRALWSGEVRHG